MDFPFLSLSLSPSLSSSSSFTQTHIIRPYRPSNLAAPPWLHFVSIFYLKLPTQVDMQLNKETVITSLLYRGWSNFRHPFLSPEANRFPSSFWVLCYLLLSRFWDRIYSIWNIKTVWVAGWIDSHSLKHNTMSLVQLLPRSNTDLQSSMILYPRGLSLST